MQLTIYALPKTKISYTNKHGKKKTILPKSLHFKKINSANPTSYWVGKYTYQDVLDLDEKIDIENFLNACPNFLLFQAIPGGKVYESMYYLIGEDFRNIDDEMLRVFDLMVVDLNKTEDESFSQLREFLVKNKGNKIFSALEE